MSGAEQARETPPTPLWRILGDLFPPPERWRVAGVLGLSALAAFFETVGVASIFPFMSLVLDPSAMDRYGFLTDAARRIGVTSPRGMLILLGATTAGIIAMGNLVGALNVWVLQKFLARTQSRLSAYLFRSYLRQPYAFHVHRDAPSLIKVLHNDAGLAVHAVVSPVLGGGSRTLVALGILGLLFVRTPYMAVTVAIVLGAAYYGMYRGLRERQRRLGVEYNRKALEYIRLVQETFGGIKELQVLGRESYAIRRQEAAVVDTTSAQAASTTFAQIPRYLLETVAFGGILLLAVLLVMKGENTARDVVPTLALYAFAGFRLMPAVQNVFLAAIGVRFALPTLRGLHEDYVEIRQIQAETPVRQTTEAAPKLAFSRAIELRDVSFRYANSQLEALSDVNLTIRPVESIGLVGRTGAGKTTLADIILGLYEPTSGVVTVDGVPLVGPAVRSWRKHVGYVSQHVFLSNSSIADNIAFGLPPDEIDHAAVHRAATLAQASEFIDRLPARYGTVVGERGVKLSGGQRQRIGIARALYHEPEVLVFDEATSALDGLTEDSLMGAIRALSRERTIILIAHRMRTVEACDRIVMLDAGRIIGDGSYDELLRTSEAFRTMVGRGPLSASEAKARA